MPAKPKTYDDLTYRQQRACHAFANKYQVPVATVAAHLDSFFNLEQGIITKRDLEQEVGFDIFDKGTLPLFGE